MYIATRNFIVFIYKKTDILLLLPFLRLYQVTLPGTDKSLSKNIFIGNLNCWIARLLDWLWWTVVVEYIV